MCNLNRTKNELFVETAATPKERNIVELKPDSSLLERAERRRLEVSLKINAESRSTLGQFFTPAAVSRLLAQMIEPKRDGGSDVIRVLDAGAGTGMLTAAFVAAAACGWREKPRKIIATAFEIDENLIPYLRETLADCRNLCEKSGIEFSFEIENKNFIFESAKILSITLFEPEREGFDLILLNPPYGKINSNSETNRVLRGAGIEVPNLYAAFLALAAERLAENGEIIAITPRSFCNGTYFRRFREFFLKRMSFRRFHVFASRRAAFKTDAVLQENVIFRAVKTGKKIGKIVISTSDTPEDSDFVFREVEPEELINPHDKESFIRLSGDELNNQVAERMKRFQANLADLGLSVSTGRVVDFRAAEFLRRSLNGENAAPLIYPYHLKSGSIAYPNPNPKKCEAILVTNETRNLLVETGVYVLVKRFSAKEERRRVTAAVFEPVSVEGDKVGFENHLNYFHAGGKGIEIDLARGLALYLNSGFVDAYFRQFNGHTQVNAGDLRYLKYPTREELENLGREVCDENFPAQDEIDSLINRYLFPMNQTEFDPIAAKKRIEEAVSILKSLGFPAAQQNERSALTLLALLDMRAETAWREAAAPLRGVTQMMDFFAETYGKQYKPNTRESVRRQTIHQFLEAGMILINPDEPTRPINSGKTVYQIEPAALELLRAFGSET